MRKRTIEVETSVTVLEHEDGSVTYHFEYTDIPFTMPDGSKVNIKFTQGEIEVAQVN
jgi:hypothetical protein